MVRYHSMLVVQKRKILELIRRLRETKNVTLRNDTDGRSRLNVNIFTGDVIVTDFGDDDAPLGNVQHDSLQKSV